MTEIMFLVRKRQHVQIVQNRSNFFNNKSTSAEHIKMFSLILVSS